MSEFQTENFFLDPGINIKEEPALHQDSIMNTSASVPIPSRRLIDLSDFRAFDHQQLYDAGAPPDAAADAALWGSRLDDALKSEAFMHMDDEDDIFQVDKADLIQGPTLAELNANDDTYFSDLNFDDLLLPGDCAPPHPSAAPSPPFPAHLAGTGSLFASSSCPQPGMLFYREEAPPPPAPQPRSTLHELLLRTAPEPGRVSRLSSSAPNQLGLAELWVRREPRKHLLSTGSLAEAGSTSSLSTGGVLSPDHHDYSFDEFDSDDESDDDRHYEDVSSDIDTDDEGHPGRSGMSKKERFFWQYNVQAKGPKGQRLVMKSKMEDPHVLHEVTDPVFSPDCSVRGIKHSGKARKGDGNDLTPNARKLHNIGKELDKLGRVINDMTPVSELPFNVRPKSRKEKNKLASRACRLKKKAQHEANKIKLNGLEVEHRNLLNGIGQSRDVVLTKLQGLSGEKQQELSNHLETIAKSATSKDYLKKIKVAGFTTDYVNRILDRLKKGQPLVGIDDNP